MYLQIGQNTVVREDSVVGIFDIDNTTSSHITRKFLNSAEKAGNLINIAEDIPKSFIVCTRGDGYTVYLSQLSTATLNKRAQTVL